MMDVRVLVTEANAKRLSPFGRNDEKMDINTNLNMKGFERKNENAGVVRYTVNISYSPNIARVDISGECHIQGEESEIDRLESEEENVGKDVSESILHTSLVEAVKLTDIINTMPPVPLPSVETDEGKVGEEDVGPEFR